jgi:hypothetical protein
VLDDELERGAASDEGQGWPDPPGVRSASRQGRVEQQLAEIADIPEAPGTTPAATVAPLAEDVLRARVLGVGAEEPPASAERSRLTPATLVALLLLVLSAGASFTFVLARGGVALPSPSARPAAAVATTRPSASPSPIVSASAAASVVPADTAKASPASAAPTASTSASTATVRPDRHYDDSDAAIAYSGAWGTASGAGYTGGAVTWTATAGASATLTFSSRTITWFGPIGPTRGSATVYLDGTAFATISSYEGSYTARRPLFTHDFGSVGTHTIRIVAAGTPDHPTVAIDELLAGF